MADSGARADAACGIGRHIPTWLAPSISRPVVPATSNVMEVMRPGTANVPHKQLGILKLRPVIGVGDDDGCAFGSPAPP